MINNNNNNNNLQNPNKYLQNSSIFFFFFIYLLLFTVSEIKHMLQASQILIALQFCAKYHSKCPII